MQEHECDASEEETTETGQPQTQTQRPRRTGCLIAVLLGLLAIVLGGSFLTQGGSSGSIGRALSRGETKP